MSAIHNRQTTIINRFMEEPLFYPADPTNTEVRHSKMASMAIVGHITRKTCNIWVRLYLDATWWLVVSEKPISGNLDTLDDLHVDQFLSKQGITAITSKVKISQDTDNTHTFLVKGLAPGKRYYYAVVADYSDKERITRRTEIGYQDRPFFDALPENLSNITFGFFSCHDPFSTATRSEGAWPLYYDTLVERNALFSIGGGDQVYVDTNNQEDMYSVWEWLAKYKNAIVENHTRDGILQETALVEYFAGIYRNYYRIYWNFFNLQKTFARFPQYMIWDDHEIMDGWGSYTQAERKQLLNKLFQDDDDQVNDRIILLMFQAAKMVYLEYQHCHNPTSTVDLAIDRNPDCQWDYKFAMGNYAFYVLDMRGHHDYERRTQGNALLGDLQMERFTDWLGSSSVRGAEAAIIVSPVPVVHWGALVSKLDIGSSKDDIRDEWEHESNHAERKKLLDAILSYSHELKVPIVILSGDVHSASVYALENDENYPHAKVFNVTSSSISRKPAPERAEDFMKKTGNISGYEGGYATRYYTLAGEYNFVIIDLQNTSNGASIVVDLYWPGGKQRETVKKRIRLV